MLNNIFNKFLILPKFDKAILLLVIIIILIIALNFLKHILNFIVKTGFNLESFYKFIIKIIEIFKEYELKTIAGLINFVMFIMFLMITIINFISSNIFTELLGISKENTVKFILIIVTIFIGFISIYLLYRFDKLKSKFNN